MAEDTLSAALEREHQEIDTGIGKFIAELGSGSVSHAELAAPLEALRRHIYLEEQILFPPLRQGARVMSIFGMVRGHGEIWHTMDELAAQAASETPDHAVLRELGQKLLDLLAAHNKVEEPVIYPGADDDLDPATATELRKFLVDGVRPDGWVCEKA